ncbi:hypothetical protein CGRA01v4_07258 [Colletotrichum graminicola]|uniref:Aminoglycoside phosphotransferase domain-containing protein n=1 Tax=Colletotrichum graminicola (strain M1.001 / M2 / FGSC 10212) TaxID=645133 RepID=E3QCF0_COLGM|nr:uncharacterized protein GLRG_03682 [Colletotrichum graminicola M1.001]EFQ28538.1 hypothetical protein GLRG_03682 [Colletotrichum graminicola M1.001]WDK15977.1 hypothetical protein CGRA01v4_07258 [Colletotrichum graminicola]
MSVGTNNFGGEMARDPGAGADDDDNVTYTNTGTGSQPGPDTCPASESGGGGNDDKVAAFLARCGLRASAVAAAHDFARTKFPGCEVAPAPFQGYCSYTLLLLPQTPGGRRRDSGVEAGDGSGGGRSSSSESSDTSGKRKVPAGGERGNNLLVQFRPRRHAIDAGMCAEARGVLGGRIVPGVEDLGVLTGLETAGAETGGGGDALCAYALERAGGVSLTRFRRSSTSSGTDPRACRRRIVADLAVVFADAWRGRRDGRDIVKGKVGGSLRWRLEVLVEGLTGELREVARRVMGELAEVEGSLPWVVTHGDLVPDNILVHPPPWGEGDGAGGRRRKEMQERAGGLVGLIDWAEVEWLPFGVGMYGLEEVLGEDVPIEDDDSHGTDTGGGAGTTRFEYYSEACALRSLFWDEVGRVVGDEEVIRRAQLAQVLGVLLWRGIAFDNGALERAVDGERDWWDMQRLNAWLFGEGGLGLKSGKGLGEEEEEEEEEMAVVVVEKGVRRRWLRKVWRLTTRCFKAL